MLASDLLSDLGPVPESNLADLSNWDFLQDLDFGCVLEQGNNAETQVGGTQLIAGIQPTSNERLKEKNRKAQQRARQKKKERSQTIEAQLAETTSQLHDLRLRQRQLEARNQLLELAAANKQQASPVSAPQGSLQAEAREGVLRILDKSGLIRTQQGKALVLSVHGFNEEIKMEDVSKLPHTDIAKLYTAHVRKVAQCLLDVEGNSEAGHSALAEIHRLSVELTAVLICFSMGSPSNNGIIHSLNMENGTLFQEPPPDSNPDELLAATNFTESQQQDMLHLRRLFFGKLGQLSRVRAAIMKQMPAALQPRPVLPFNLDFKSTTNKLAETKEWADQLCANRAEESRAFLTCGFCLYRGIQTSLQHAVAMVHQYPRAPDTKVLLETVAQLHKEPSVESLVAGSGLDDQQHAASWQAVTQYLESLDANGVHGYTPFRKMASEDCSSRT
ncbi:hypothetical protein WJX77_001073 [Trebouxia sp. C0004]